MKTSPSVIVEKDFKSAEISAIDNVYLTLLQEKTIPAILDVPNPITRRLDVNSLTII